MDKSEYIARLIYYQIVGSISDDAKCDLETWLSEDVRNKRIYDELCDVEFLRLEYSRRSAVDYQHALEAMKTRIEALSGDVEEKHHNQSRTIVLTFLSTAAMALLLFGIYSYTQSHDVMLDKTQIAQVATSNKISHGVTQAMLTTDIGDTLYLGENAVSNAQQLTRIEGNKDIHINSFITPRGGEFKITLEDGTEVWLNAESCLKYPETFGNGDRHVSVEGEAYFKVAKDIEHPFYVESDGQQIRVVGTEFNVSNYPEQNCVMTTLVKGAIALKPVNGNGSELMLTPGHQADFDKSSSTATVKTVDTEIVTSWRTGKFVFENQNLGQIMKTLSRWYDFDYKFKDKQLEKTEFMGSVPRYGEFKEVLHILEASGGIHVRQKGRTILISRK